MRVGLAVAGLSLSCHLGVAALLLFPVASKPSLVEPAPQIAGATFELPAPDTDPLANASPSPDLATATPPPPTDEGDAPARPTTPARGPMAERASHQGRPSGGRAAHGQAEATSEGTGTALYGAVGDRSAADLPTAFTRAFPQAASADAAWRSAGFGSAGTAVLTLTLDESGHLTNTQVSGAPGPALEAGIRRTLALIGSRSFVARSQTTRLHLTATVSPDTVHDGLHGDVFAIGGSFFGGEGTAFFALAIGRRIDVRVRSK